MDEIWKSYVRSLQDVQVQNEHAAEIKKEQMKPVVDVCNAAFHYVSTGSSGLECYVTGGGCSGAHAM